MTIADIVGLKGFLTDHINTVLPVRTAFKISKICKFVDTSYEFYEAEFNKLLNMYGEKDENGQYILTDSEAGSIKIKDGDEVECKKKLFELDKFDFTPPDIKFTIDELEGLQIMPSQMNCLLDFIEA